ncbi:MAG: hypothetical protein AB7I41_08580 [Candidatus Sericytochromatia bacterium]
MQPTLGPSGSAYVARPTGGTPPDSPRKLVGLKEPDVTPPAAGSKERLDGLKKDVLGGGGGSSIGSPAALGAAFGAAATGKPETVVVEQAEALGALPECGAEFGVAAIPANSGTLAISLTPEQLKSILSKTPIKEIGINMIINKINDHSRKNGGKIDLDALIGGDQVFFNPERKKVAELILVEAFTPVTPTIVPSSVSGPAPFAQAICERLHSLGFETREPSIQGLGGVDPEGGSAAVVGLASQGHNVASIEKSLEKILANPNLSETQKRDFLVSFEQFIEIARTKPSGEQIIAGTLDELAFPTNISQHAVPTCAATTAQIHLAITDPVKYMNKMKEIVETTPPELCQFDRSGRTLSSQLMQERFMDIADPYLGIKSTTFVPMCVEAKGTEAVYEARKLRYEDSVGSSGLNTNQLTRLLNHISAPSTFRAIEGEDEAPALSDALSALGGKSICLPFAMGGHEVLLTGANKNKVGGFELTYIDPAGAGAEKVKKETINLDDLPQCSLFFSVSP